MHPWHIISPEFPPDCGGVGDYTAQLAAALAPAMRAPVTVWVPGRVQVFEEPPGVTVESLPDRFGRGSMTRLTAHLDAQAPGATLLVEYVPNVFGRSRANLAFCAWLEGRRQAGDDVRVMFHEPYLYFGWRPDHAAMALAQRAMAAMLLRAAARVYVSTSTWRRYLAPFGRSAHDAVELPIPSSIPRIETPAEVASLRQSLGAPAEVVGHFGTYGDHIAPLLRASLVSILTDRPSTIALCLGSGGDRFTSELARAEPRFAARLHAPGRLAASAVSIHLQACDLLLQPYPDGITTRRTSAMAGLANGIAVLSTDGQLTEPAWRETHAARLAPAGDPPAFTLAACELLDDCSARAALAERGRSVYGARFDIAHTVTILAADANAHA